MTNQCSLTKVTSIEWKNPAIDKNTVYSYTRFDMKRQIDSLEQKALMETTSQNNDIHMQPSAEAANWRRVLNTAFLNGKLPEDTVRVNKVARPILNNVSRFEV